MLAGLTFIILLFGASFFTALGYHLVMVGNEVDKHSLIGVDILDQEFLFCDLAGGLGVILGVRVGFWIPWELRRKFLSLSSFSKMNWRVSLLQKAVSMV